MMRNRIPGLMAFLILVGSLTFTGPHAGYSQGRSLVPVEVENTAAAPVPVRDVDNAAQQPFAKLVNATVAAGSATAFADFTVPPGKRLVIELLGGNASVPVGQKVIFQMVVITGTAQVGYVLPATPQGTFSTIGGGPFDVFAIGQPLRLYAEPNTTVSLGLARSDTTGQGFLGLAVSGHFIDVP